MKAPPGTEAHIGKFNQAAAVVIFNRSEQD
jgi:hypothetical protein